MKHVQALIWGGAAASLLTAVLAGWRERARKRRRDLDAVGLVQWPTVQFLALVALAVCAWLAFRL